MDLDHPVKILVRLVQGAAINIREVLQRFQPFRQKPGHRKGIFTSRIKSHSHEPAGFPEHLNKDTRSGTPYGADHHWRNSNRLEIGIGPRAGERKAIELQTNLLQPRLRHAADA